MTHIPRHAELVSAPQTESAPIIKRVGAVPIRSRNKFGMTNQNGEFAGNEFEMTHIPHHAELVSAPQTVSATLNTASATLNTASATLNTASATLNTASATLMRS